MSKSNIIKIIVGILLALAIALGLLARGHEQFNGNKPLSDVGIGLDQSLQGYYQEAQQVASQNQNSPQTASTTFLAVGDIMLSRNVAAEIQKQNSVDFPFRQMADILKSTNFNFANLEGPVAPGQPVVGGTAMVFGDASSSLQALQDFNFQVINLANNHAFDQGLGGIDITKLTLDNLGIAHEGTGDNLAEAWTPAVVTSNGIKICFVGASYGTNSGGSVAAKYVAEIGDGAHLKTSIDEAKSECDFVVATMHAGIEYTRTPDQQQITFAHEAIDDGADMVIGAHPHWIQPIEKYNGKYIFYSLGNFIFDQGFSQDTMEGLTLDISISKNVVQAPGLQNQQAGQGPALQGSRQPATLDSIQLLPVIIENTQPRPATATETKTILEKIGENQTTLYP